MKLATENKVVAIHGNKDIGFPDSMDKTENDHRQINRKYFQAIIVSIAALGLFNEAQAYGMAGYILPQIEGCEGDDGVSVSREMGSYFGEKMTFMSRVAIVTTKNTFRVTQRKPSIIMNFNSIPLKGIPMHS